MIPLAWEEIEALRLGELRGRPAGGVIRRVHDDSRDARPGDLFVALNTGVRFVSVLTPPLGLVDFGVAPVIGESLAECSKELGIVGARREAP